MLYPSREASDLHAPAHALVGDAVVDLHGLRQILSTFDRQFFPSPVTVRFGPDDIVTHRLDNGITLFLDREDGAVSRPILAGDYEAHLVPVFERFCRPGMTVVDVGANLGLYTLLASKLVGPGRTGGGDRAEFGELPPHPPLGGRQPGRERRAPASRTRPRPGLVEPVGPFRFQRWAGLGRCLEPDVGVE